MPRKKLCENNTQGALGFFPLSIIFNIVTWALTSQLWSFWKIHLALWNWAGKSVSAEAGEGLKAHFFLQGASEQIRSTWEAGAGRITKGPLSEFPCCPCLRPDRLTFREGVNVGQWPGKVTAGTDVLGAMWPKSQASHHKVALTPLPQGRGSPEWGPGGPSSENVCAS